MERPSAVAQEAPTSDRPWSRPERTVLVVSCVGLFATQLDITVVNLALRGIGDSLHASARTLTWVVGAYLVCFSAFILGFGEVSDRCGSVRVFRAGVTGFVAASVGCAVAGSAWVLVGVRAAQGVAAAAIVVSSLSLLAEGIEESRRTRAIGWWAAVAGLSLVLGPLVGGAMVGALGWRSLFWCNLPVGVLAIWVSLRLPSAAWRRVSRQVDWLGQLLVVGALATSAWGVSAGAETGFGWHTGWLVLAGGILAGGLLVVIERRKAEPLIPFELFGDRRLAGATFACLLVNFCTLGLLYLVSFDLEVIGHLGAAAAGMRVLPLFGAYVAGSSIAGRVVVRLGPRRCATTGLVLSALAAALESRVSVGSVAGSLELIALGAGVGLGLPPLVAAAVGALPGERFGVASGLNNTARQVGGTFGVALLGGIAVRAGPATAGVREAIVVVAVGYALSALAGYRALAPGAGGRSAR